MLACRGRVRHGGFGGLRRFARGTCRAPHWAGPEGSWPLLETTVRFGHPGWRDILRELEVVAAIAGLWEQNATGTEPLLD